MNTLVIILGAIIAAGPLVGNALIALFRAIGKPTWADKVAQFAPMVLKAVTIIDQQIEAPKQGETK